MRLRDKLAVVTGAGGAIGQAICVRLAGEGALIVATDVDQERAAQVLAAVEAGQGKGYALGLDVTSTASVQCAMQEVLKRSGHIDILVNNAGGSAGLRQELTDFKDAREEVWQWVLNLNLAGTMRCTQAVLAGMIEQKAGRIINIASIAAEVGIKQRSDYAAAKAGIISFSKTLAMEVGAYGITVNCISPGLIARNVTVETTDQELKSNGTYLGRCGRPAEIAAAVAYFASEEAAYITGANLTVDGGRVLGPKASV
jgi:3-oxoacyl-[acyl-carrier protein] reductase